MKAWDHSRCDGHFRHPAFTKKLCIYGEPESTARTFADEIAAIASGHASIEPFTLEQAERALRPGPPVGGQADYRPKPRAAA